MSDTPEPDPESSGYLRLPLPVVGIGLFVLIAVLLALGLYANANLRSPGVVIPTPVAASTPPANTAAPVAAAPTQIPSATPVPVAATATPTSAPGTSLSTPPLLVPAQTPALVDATSVAVLATSQSPSATAVTTAIPLSPPSTPTPTVSPELAAEVGDAYQAYWQVRAQALYDLDATHLPEVMSGDHLAAAQDLLTQLRSEGRAIQTNVSHNYVVVSASDTSAKVADEYVDNSVYVDISSHNDLSQPTGATVREEYEMEKQDGSWRVVSLVRDSS